MSTYNINVTVNPQGAQSGAQQVNSALASMEQRAQRLEQLFRRVFAIESMRRLVVTLVQTADAYTQMHNRLGVVTTSSAQLAVVQQELFDISQRTRTDLPANVEMFVRLDLALKDLGASQRQVLDFQETLNQAIQLSGASASEARAGIFQLSQAMSKGRLDGDELRSTLENLPMVADIIAKSMGVARGELRKLGEEGKLTGQVVTKAFADSRAEVADRFGKTVPTVEQAVNNLGNSFVNFTGKVDGILGATRALANGILFVSETLDILARQVEDVNLASLRGQIEAAKVERQSLLRLQYGEDDGLSGFMKRLKDRLVGEKSGIDPDIVERQLLKIHEAEVDAARQIEEIEKRRADMLRAREELSKPREPGRVPPTPEAEKYTEMLRRQNAELDKEHELLALNNEEREITAKLLDIEEKFTRNKTPLRSGDLAALEERMVMLQQLKVMTGAVEQSFQTLFKGMEDGLVGFVQTGKIEFKRFADAVVADLVRITLQAYVTRPLMNMAQGVANPLIASMGSSTYSANGWTNTVTPSLFGFAEGGSFRVGGSGGVDSQLVAFRASPDERVTVTRPDQALGNSMTVNVVNNTGAEVREERRREGGVQVVDIVIGEMKKAITNGTLDDEMGVRYGAAPRQSRR